MKIKEGFVLRKIADHDIVTPIGNRIADFNGIITLNESAAFLWKRMMDDTQKVTLVDALAQYFGIEKERAEKDVEAFIGRLREAKILDEGES